MKSHNSAWFMRPVKFNFSTRNTVKNRSPFTKRSHRETVWLMQRRWAPRLPAAIQSSLTRIHACLSKRASELATGSQRDSSLRDAAGCYIYNALPEANCTSFMHHAASCLFTIGSLGRLTRLLEIYMTNNCHAVFKLKNLSTRDNDHQRWRTRFLIVFNNILALIERSCFIKISPGGNFVE